jgi:hypothetical protein
LSGGNEGGGDVTAAQVFGERGCDLPRDVAGCGFPGQRGRPCEVAAMHISIGIDRMKLMREA